MSAVQMVGLPESGNSLPQNPDHSIAQKIEKLRAAAIEHTLKPLKKELRNLGIFLLHMVLFAGFFMFMGWLLSGCPHHLTPDLEGAAIAGAIVGGGTGILEIERLNKRKEHIKNI